MISPDTNLLLYGYNVYSPLHAEAYEYLEQIFSGPEPVGLPLPCVHSFLRIVTLPAFGKARITIHRALAIVGDWTALPHVSILYPGPTHWRLLQELARQANATGNLLPDAAIAAIAIEHNATVHTHDRDFARFPNLRWHNPLVPSP